MFRKVGSGPTLLVYELFRVFLLCATRVGRLTVNLPATWYAAAPLLVLPFILQLLCQREREHAAVYGRLYLLTKGLSILGCLVYVMRIWMSAFSATNAIDYYAFSESRIFNYFVIFSLVDVILIIIIMIRKKRKGGAKNASFD